MPPEQTAADIAVLKEKVERLELTLQRISDGIEGLASSKDAIEEIAEATVHDSGSNVDKTDASVVLTLAWNPGSASPSASYIVPIT